MIQTSRRTSEDRLGLCQNKVPRVAHALRQLYIQVVAGNGFTGPRVENTASFFVAEQFQHKAAQGGGLDGVSVFKCPSCHRRSARATSGKALQHGVGSVPSSES